MVKKLKRNYAKVFSTIRELLDFPDPLKKFVANSRDMNDDYNLWNPNGKGTILILQIYSMEPPYYAALNEACRRMDTAALDLFGPFAAAIAMVTLGAEIGRADKK